MLGVRKTREQNSDALLPRGAYILTQSRSWEKLVSEKGTSVSLCCGVGGDSVCPGASASGPAAVLGRGLHYPHPAGPGPGSWKLLQERRRPITSLCSRDIQGGCCCETGVVYTKFGGCIRDTLQRRPRLGGVSLGRRLKAGLMAGGLKGVE